MGKETRDARASRDATNAQKQRRRKRNENCRKARLDEVIVSADHIGDYAAFQPDNSWTGAWGATSWFSGKNYAVSERERLKFDRSCATCKNEGKEKCNQDECTIRGHWHWNKCTKDCTECAGLRVL